MAELRQKINVTRDLKSVVATMRALAAVNIRQYQEAVDALDIYRETIEMGLQIILQHGPVDLPQDESTDLQNQIAVILGSNQGLVGQFNQHVVDYAHKELKRLSPEAQRICAVGLRLPPYMDDLPYSVDSILDVPGDRAGITPTVREILLQIEEWRKELSSSLRLTLFFNQPTGQATYETKRIDLLPLDQAWLDKLRQRSWASSSIPMSRAEWIPLFRQIIQQYLFSSLYFALASSLASENASRLASMESAKDNIEDRLSDLQKQFNRQRQQSITEELFDVIAGFEILQDTQRE